MPRISTAFFAIAALCGLTGMVWGLYMGASQDFTTHPAHAHLNLVGWLGLAVMGAYYALDRGAPRRLAWINFWLSASGAIILPFGIAMIVLGKEGFESAAIVGGFLSLAGMISFFIAVMGGLARMERG